MAVWSGAGDAALNRGTATRKSTTGRSAEKNVVPQRDQFADVQIIGSSPGRGGEKKSGVEGGQGAPKAPPMAHKNDRPVRLNTALWSGGWGCCPNPKYSHKKKYHRPERRKKNVVPQMDQFTGVQIIGSPRGGEGKGNLSGRGGAGRAASPTHGTQK